MDNATVLINNDNIDQFKKKGRHSYNTVLLDVNSMCNLQCIYCQSSEYYSKAVMNLNTLNDFLHTKVNRTKYLQLGCGFEPTLNHQLGEIAILVKESPARPTKNFVLQTNGVLLHRHDYSLFREAGITILSVSLDTVDQDLHARLRNNSDLEGIITNIMNFKEAHPMVAIRFMSTVTQLNIDRIDDLIKFGLSINVFDYIIREVTYDPLSRSIDHKMVKDLVLVDHQFDIMKCNLIRDYHDICTIVFHDKLYLMDVNRTTIR